MLHFGTGGWRAIIGDEFTKSNIQLVAKAVAVKILEEHQESIPVVIGYDRRFLSKEAMVWAGEVIASNGIRAMLVERSSPTPLIKMAGVDIAFNDRVELHHAKAEVLA